MIGKLCKKCKRKIIEDWFKWLEENKDKYIQCPYCNEFEDIR